MTTKSDLEDWNEEEQAAFAALPRAAAPPPGLEDRLVDALAVRGYLPRRRWRRGYASLGAVAAALLVFFGGLQFGRHMGGGGPTDMPAVDTPRFLLLVYSEAGEVLSAEDEAERVEEYSAWAALEGRAGRLFGGEKLDLGGRLLGAAEGRVLEAQDAVSNAAWELGGFFLLTADGWDAALEIAQRCPHLRYGGRLVLRRIAGVP